MSVFETVKEQVADSLSGTDCYGKWLDNLSETDPGHYGLDDVEFQVAKEDIWVDLPKRTFTYKNGDLSFTARLGGSSEESGADMHFTKTVSGRGTFSWDNSIVKIEDVSINGHVSLFDPKVDDE